MLEVRATSRFKKDLKKRSGQKDLDKLGSIIDLLQAEKPLPEQNRDHGLTGKYRGHRECHISPDWLLIYKIHGRFLVLVRTGSHSELFG